MKVLYSLSFYLLEKDLFQCVSTLEKSIKNYKKNNSHILIIANSKINKLNFSNFKNLTIVQNKKNLGFTAFVNQSIKFFLKNNYEYLSIINQDIKFYKNSIGEIFRGINSTKKKGIFSPVQLSENGKLDFNTPKVTANILRGVAKEKIQSVKFVNAACWFINKDVINKVGFFNNSFFHFGSDDDYVQRCKLSNFGVYLVVKAKIKHTRKFYEKNNKKYLDMQRLSRLESVFFLKTKKNPFIIAVFIYFFLKPLCMLFLGKISLYNIFKFYNIKTLVKAYKNYLKKDKIYLKFKN